MKNQRLHVKKLAVIFLTAVAVIALLFALRHRSPDFATLPPGKQNQVSSDAQQRESTSIQTVRPPSDGQLHASALKTGATPQAKSPQSGLQVGAKGNNARVYATKSAAHNLAARDGEYERMFSSFGLDSDTREMLRKKLRVLYELKTLASITTGAAKEDSLRDFYKALSIYDNEMKSLLGPDKYPIYREFELKLQSRREYADFTGYCAANAITIPPDFDHVFESLIEANQCYATTLREWGGPYQPIAETPTETQDALRLLKARVADLERSSSRVLDQLRLPYGTGGIADVLKEYYGSKIEKQKRDIGLLEYPAAYGSAIFASGLQTARKPKNISPQDIERAEAKLRDLRAKN